MYYARFTPAQATDFHLCDCRSHYLMNELLFRSAKSLCLIACAFYLRCSCSIYQDCRQLLGGWGRGKILVSDAEGTIVVTLGLRQNNLKYQNNLKSHSNDGFTYTMNHYHLTDTTGLPTTSSAVLNLFVFLTKNCCLILTLKLRFLEK